MLVAILELEKDLQVGDKTRFNAEKSFAVKGVDAITSVKIKPSDAASPIEVFDLSNRNWFLDWVFSDFQLDIDSTLNSFSFTDSSTYTVAIPDGGYNLSALATAIQSAMNGVSSGYSVTVTPEQELKIVSSSPFKLNTSNLVDYLGFETREKKTEQISAVLEHLRRKVTLEVSNGTLTASKDFYLDVYNEYGDRLFSKDSDLVAEEPEVLKWVVKGRSSHLNIHRKAQRLIIDWLDKNNYVDVNGNKITKWNILDVTQLQQWSQYIALRFIFASIYNAQDDVFKDKAALYEKYEIAARSRAIIDLKYTNEEQSKLTQASPSTWSANIIVR